MMENLKLLTTKEILSVVSAFVLGVAYMVFLFFCVRREDKDEKNK